MNKFFPCDIVGFTLKQLSKLKYNLDITSSDAALLVVKQLPIICIQCFA